MSAWVMDPSSRRGRATSPRFPRGTMPAASATNPSWSSTGTAPATMPADGRYPTGALGRGGARSGRQRPRRIPVGPLRARCGGGRPGLTVWPRWSVYPAVDSHSDAGSPAPHNCGPGHSSRQGGPGVSLPVSSMAVVRDVEPGALGDARHVHSSPVAVCTGRRPVRTCAATSPGRVSRRGGGRRGRAGRRRCARSAPTSGRTRRGRRRSPAARPPRRPAPAPTRTAGRAAPPGRRGPPR
jgi:hypothetical protein